MRFSAICLFADCKSIKITGLHKSSLLLFLCFSTLASSEFRADYGCGYCHIE